MELANKKIMVIGGAGFVGSHIVDQLLAEPVEQVIVYDNFVRGTRANLAQVAANPRVKIVDASVTDNDLLRRELEGVDGVFHLAALWLGECVDDPRSAVNVNIVGTYNVIEACRDLGIQRIVYSSSASVYGDAITTPMTEEHPFNNRTMYGATKIAGEQMFRAIFEQHKLPYVGYRYMNIYGPRMDYKGTYVSVIMRVLDRIAEGKAPVIFGDGSQSYDFVYVTDIARANILGMKANATDEFFNIGMGVRTTINELVDVLLELTGSSLQPEYKPQEKMFVQHRIGSTEKAERLLGYKAQVPLVDGLREVVQWRISQGLNLSLAQTNR
jgi:UDP-glucose 4-epimerase